MTRARILVLLLSLIAAGPLAAQGNQGAESLSGARADSGTGGGGATAHAGADTVDGTTTGFSGPPSDVGGGPPALTPALCEAYAGTPAHADCLNKTLGETSP